MVLHVDSDAEYLTILEARSCYAGNFYISYWPSPKMIKPNPERNGTIYTELKTTRNIVSSAAEAELCGTSNNGKKAIGMKPYLIILDHKQPVTPLKTDNYTTERFVNSGMKPKRSKTWHMKWHWLRYKEMLEKLRVYWDIGEKNDADYFIRYYPPIHHRQMRPRYMHTSNLERKITQTINLCKGVLNQVPGT